MNLSCIIIAKSHLYYISFIIFYYYGSIFSHYFIKYIAEPYSILNYRSIYFQNFILITIMCVFIFWIYFTIFLLILMHNFLLFLLNIFKIIGDSILYIFYSYNIFYFCYLDLFFTGYHSISKFVTNILCVWNPSYLFSEFNHYFSFLSID
jgi:hypothetical protein